MPIRTTTLDTAEHLNSAEDIAHYLEAAFEGGDAAHIRNALNTVARSRGIAQVEANAGLGADAIRKAVDEGIKLDTLLKITKALGVELSAKVSTLSHGRAR